MHQGEYDEIKICCRRMERTSSGGEYMTGIDHEDAQFFPFLAQDTNLYGHDKAKWRKAARCQEKELRRIGDPLLSFTEYRQSYDGWSVCYGKG